MVRLTDLDLQFESQYVHYIAMDTIATAQISTNEFPILKHGLYANHAAMAPWPRTTLEAVTAFAEENCQQGPEKYARWLLRETRLRERLAKLINANSVQDIALLKNTTEGICTVSTGIDWRKGDNMVIPMEEFPSNRLPWLALQQQGVEVREVDIRTSSDPEQALLERIDKHTRLLSVSAVQWIDGLRLRLETLGYACRQNEVLFFVDAIQHLGALQMDVQACNIDFLAADGHKWLLAPEGIAVFYCRAEVRDQLKLQQHGWRMVDEPYRFERDNWRPANSAIRFEAGSPNMLGQVALFASIGLLQDVGMQKVEACIAENSLILAEGLGNLTGVELIRAFEPQTFSGIVSFKIPGRKLTDVHRSLNKAQLACAMRGNAIRLSPHFYQTGKPIYDILNVIESIV